MKILFVITGLGVGGAEVQVCNLAKEFINKGHCVSIVYLFGNVSVWPDERVVIKKIGLSKINIFTNFFSLLNLSYYIRKEKFDVIHSHMYHANIFSRVVNIFSRNPNLICSAHNFNEGGRLRMLVYKITDNLCRLTTNVGAKSLNRFIKIGAMKKEKSYAVYNGIDTSFFSASNFKLDIKKELGLDDGSFKFLCVGRNHEQKNYVNFLKGFALNFKNEEVMLIIVGSKVKDLSILCSDLGITDQVKLYESRNDVYKFMQACDCFVLPSKWEGLPLVVGEAMSAEMPVVAMDVGSTGQWFVDDSFLIDPKNFEDIFPVMQTVLNMNSHQIKKIGLANRSFINANYSLSSVSEFWEDLYTKDLF